MGRRLPDYDSASDGPYKTSKRRREIFKRIYRQREHWLALQEDQGMPPFITTPDGEDIYYGDMMVGLDALAATAPQQLKAFQRICLEGFTEAAATEEILPDSKWSTPVQQYSDDGLKKMIAAYDAKQDRTWDPQAALKRKPTKKREPPVSTEVESVPEVPEPTQEDALTAKSRVDSLNWTVCSEDNQSLADYITKATGGLVTLTGQQVKAVAFLRNPWYHSPEQVEHRAEVAARKKAAADKYAYETPEQREKRFEAARRLRAAEAAAEKAQRLQSEVRELRIAAGLDPDTGEPVNVS